MTLHFYTLSKHFFSLYCKRIRLKILSEYKQAAPTFDYFSLNCQTTDNLIAGWLFVWWLGVNIILQSKLVTRNFLVILKLFLDVKYSLFIWSKLAIWSLSNRSLSQFWLYFIWSKRYLRENDMKNYIFRGCPALWFEII